MTHFFVVKKSIKSWALQVEELLRIAASGKKSTVMDFSSCLSWRPISFGRARTQFSMRRVHNITWISYQKFGLVNFLSITKSLSYLCKFLMLGKQRLPQLPTELAFAQDAILCRLSQTMGTRYFSVREIPLFYLFKFARETFLGYIAFRINNEEKSHITLFNGRDPLESMIIRASLDAGLKVNLLERASSESRYENYSKSPHYQPEWWYKAKSFWEESQPIDLVRRREIQKYLEQKSMGFDSFLGQKWQKYYVEQEHDLNFLKPFVVFFTTSTHEFSPITEYECELGFPDQLEATKVLSNTCKKLGYRLVIRRHPNSLSPFDEQDREAAHWQGLVGANTFVFGPRDKVNSIELAKNSHVAFVWRSSIGLETLFKGIPTFALGSARWALDESVRAWSEEKIGSVILNPVQNSRSALDIYANYMVGGGIPLNRFAKVNRNFVTTLNNDRLYMYLGDRFLLALRDWSLNSIGSKTRRKA